MKPSAAGFQPQNGVEYLPFIEGFARQNDWQQAARLSMQANRISEAMPKILCPTWDQIAAEMQAIPRPASDARRAAPQAAMRSIDDPLSENVSEQAPNYLCLFRIHDILPERPAMNITAVLAEERG